MHRDRYMLYDGRYRIKVGTNATQSGGPRGAAPEEALETFLGHGSALLATWNHHKTGLEEWLTDDDVIRDPVERIEVHLISGPEDLEGEMHHLEKAAHQNLIMLKVTSGGVTIGGTLITYPVENIYLYQLIAGIIGL